MHARQVRLVSLQNSLSMQQAGPARELCETGRWKKEVCCAAESASGGQGVCNALLNTHPYPAQLIGKWSSRVVGKTR